MVKSIVLGDSSLKFTIDCVTHYTELNLLTLEISDVPVSSSVMKVMSGLMLTLAVGMKVKLSTWPCREEG